MYIYIYIHTYNIYIYIYTRYTYIYNQYYVSHIEKICLHPDILETSHLHPSSDTRTPDVRLQSEANHLHRGVGGRIEIAFGLAQLEVQPHLYTRVKIKLYKYIIYVNIIEGSLEVKLPTIWTDEKQSRAEAERRERLEERRVEEKESEERRCRCAKR